MDDNSVDAVIIAQGFHWFSDLESLKEIYRILKPEGKLGLIWNFDYTSPCHDSPIGKTEFYNAGSQYFRELEFNVAKNNKEVFEQFLINNHGIKLSLNTFMNLMYMFHNIDMANGKKS